MQKPKCIFLKIGVNDIFWGFNMDTIRSNYFQIVKKIVDKKIPLFILSTNQVSENFKNHKKINSQVVELNNYLIQLSTDLNLTYVDINSNLTNSSGLKNRFTPDGIHLNLLGYMSFKKSIEPFLNNIN
jgi:lysophospholipase L1-like esterase